ARVYSGNGFCRSPRDVLGRIEEEIRRFLRARFRRIPRLRCQPVVAACIRLTIGKKRQRDGQCRHRGQQEEHEDECDAAFVAHKSPYDGIIPRRAVMVAGVDWIRSVYPAPASSQALNTFRGDTFSSAFVSVWNCLVTGSTCCVCTVNVMATSST